MSFSDLTPRFTEADLRKAHRAGWLKRSNQAKSFAGPYQASFWDFEPLRKQLGLGPK